MTRPIEMLGVRCPHCAKRIFTLGGASDPGCCPRCGEALIETDPIEVERAVHERLYGVGAHAKGRAVTRPAPHGAR